jgi:N-acetylglucosamine-6-phosphate deacetylase
MSLFDLQVNGALGIGFTSSTLTVGEVRRVSHHLASRGIGGYLPTVITASFDTLAHSLQTLAFAVSQDATLKAMIPGFHLEGPYLAPEDGPRGAHPLHHVRNPDWDEFRRLQDAAAGMIRLVTLAPERPGAIDFIGKLCQQGIVVALGHTAASPAMIREAIRAGARLSTHLGNGSHTLLPRHENYLWEQLAAEELQATVIADSHHLPAALLKVFLKAKGPENLILISDASPLAGLPAGRYRHWDADLEIDGSGRIGVAGTPFLAGSGLFLDECVKKMAAMTGIAMTIAERMASENPRKLLGLPLMGRD